MLVRVLAEYRWHGFIKQWKLVVRNINQFEFSVLALFTYAIHPIGNSFIVASWSRTARHNRDSKHVYSPSFRIPRSTPHCERRASRLNGPAPNCEMSNAPPRIAMFFMNGTIWICCIIGSAIAQNLCIIRVTGTKNNAISQAPSLARYPSRMLRPPASASIPESGTVTEASGTPCDAANAIVCLEK